MDEGYRQHRYRCGLQIADGGDHELPDACPFCGAPFARVVGVGRP